MRQFPGGAARAIRHADKTGPVGLQFTNSLVQGGCRLFVFGRKEFKGQGGTGVRLQSFFQVHVFSFFAWMHPAGRIRVPWEQQRLGRRGGGRGSGSAVGRGRIVFVQLRQTGMPACRGNNHLIPWFERFLVVAVKELVSFHIGLVGLAVRINAIHDQRGEDAPRGGGCPVPGPPSIPACRSPETTRGSLHGCIPSPGPPARRP